MWRYVCHHRGARAAGKDWREARGAAKHRTQNSAHNEEDHLAQRSNSAKREKTSLIRVSRVGDSWGLGHPWTRGHWTRLTPSPPPQAAMRGLPLRPSPAASPSSFPQTSPLSCLTRQFLIRKHVQGTVLALEGPQGTKADKVPAFFKELRGCRERQHIFKCYECYIGTNKALRYQKLEGPNFNQDWKGL